MPKTLMTASHLYVPFETVERKDDGYYVTGYAFCNEVVPGEGGIRIRRTAMEEATPEYMRFANVREMHQRQAAGIATEAIWDSRGCKLTAKIVDPIARLKCEEKVYTGFSIGVQPTVMRGKDVEKLAWVETSLVDRPRDPDAVIAAFRADGYDPQTPQEVEVLEPEPGTTTVVEHAAEGETERGISTATPNLPIRENLESKSGEGTGADPTKEPPRCKKCGTICRSCAASMGMKPSDYDRTGGDALCRTVRPQGDGYEILSHDEQEPLVVCRSQEAAQALLGEVRPFSFWERIDADLIPHLRALEDESLKTLARARTAETELAGVQAQLAGDRQELAAAKERIAVLERTPAPRPGPVTFTDQFRPAHRTFAANLEGGQAERVARQTAILERIQHLEKEPPTDQQARFSAACEMNQLKQELESLRS